MAIIEFSVAIIGIVFATISFILAIKVLKFDRVEHEKTRARYSGAVDAIRGLAQVRQGKIPDGRVQAGMSYNKRKSQIELNGKISDDVVDKFLD